MERGALARWTWLLIFVSLPCITSADITCTACPSPIALRRGGLRMDLRMDVWEPGKAFPKAWGSPQKISSGRASRLTPTSGDDADDAAQVVTQQGTAEMMPLAAEGELHDKVSDPGLADETPSAQSDSVSLSIKTKDQEQVGENKDFKRKKLFVTETSKFGKDTEQRRLKRSSPENGDWSESLLDGKQSDTRKISNPSLDGQRMSRTEGKWTREDGKVTLPKHEELKVVSSTFALTGDSAHNQAMVLWSGHNSSTLKMDGWIDPKNRSHVPFC